MTDGHEEKATDAAGKQEGEETELTGQPMDPGSTPHRAKGSDKDTGKADSKQAQDEQDRQLERGEESPS